MTDNTLAIPTVAASQGNVDVSQVTNPATGSPVLREKIVIADPNNFSNQAAVSGAGRVAVDDSDSMVLNLILRELRMIKFVLSNMSGTEIPPQVADDELSG
jgi:hypothetical protein